jgi:proteasome lid subunit RPN8/RPN11
MFNVSISKSVLERIMDSANETEYEIIGLLLGSVVKNTVVIEDSVSGAQESGSMHASLSPATIAKISDQILTGELEGKIVGWYHSHPGFGLFMSPTDVATQSNFQQFSNKVTAMVVDPRNDEFAFFFLDEEKEVAWLEKDQVHIFSEDEEKIPKAFTPLEDKEEEEEETEEKSNKIEIREKKSKDSSPKIVVLGIITIIAVILIGGVIGGMLVKKHDFNSLDTNNMEIEILSTEVNKNQMGISIFKDTMEVRTNLEQGCVASQGVNFHLGRIGQGWELIGHIPSNDNNNYTLVFDTKEHDEGTHQIKVNFSDSKENFWEGISELFIIDNIADVPVVRFLDPREGDIIDGILTIYVEATDSENNVYSVEISYKYGNGNWTIINEVVIDQFVYIATWDTEPLVNGTYQIKASCVDSNLYIAEAVITVDILHGG